MADPWEELRAEAVAIVAAASARDVTLRVVGSAGIRLHCPAPGPVMDRLDRPAKDIDFVVPQRHRKGMRRVLEERGYLVDRDLLVAMEGTRYSFEHREQGTQIDVFVERLDFCHTIEVAGRLADHPVTIPIEELLLAKLQIVDMTTTDLIDACVLLATHEVAAARGAAPAGAAPAHGAAAGEGGVAGEGNAADPETVDAGRIAALLARDWGFHHTTARNLGRIEQSVAGTGLGEQEAAGVRRGIGRLRAAIDAAPKSLAWRMRGKIGERKQWWQDVDDREATY